MSKVRSAWVVVLALLVATPLFALQSPNLVKNGSFEIEPAGPGFAWFGPLRTPQGEVGASPANRNSGQFSLKLSPTELNGTSFQSGTVFGVGQMFPGKDLAGQILYISGWLQADAGSNAMLGVYALRLDGRVEVQEIRQKHAGDPVFRRDILIVPDDVEYVIVLCLVEGTSGAAYFDDIALTPGQPADWPEAIGVSQFGDFLEATISVSPARHLRQIPRTLYGTNIEWIFNGHGIWDSESATLNPLIVSMTREMGVTLHRFPGGVFSDFYFWKDGVGPHHLRPETAALPTGPASTHLFGTDEALRFAEATDGQLMLTVNVATGTAEQAAEWVQYVNGGGRRVLYWEIGNESYFAGDDPHVSAAMLTPEQYTARFLQFARAMRSVDPEIKIGAIADENYSHSVNRSFPNWTDYLLKNAGGEIDFIAVHSGYAPLLWVDKGWNPRTVYSAMLAAPQLIGEQLRDLSERIEKLVPGRDIKIAVTEWGPFFHSSTDSRFVDHTKTLGSALFVASTLKAFVESSRTDIANLFKLTDNGFMGWIGRRDGLPAPKASTLALQMFTKYFGTELIHSESVSPTYDSPTVGWVDAARVPYLDVIASRDYDGSHIYILAINKHFDAPIQSRISIEDYQVAKTAAVVTLVGTGLDANTGTDLVQFPGFPWARQAEVLPATRFYAGARDEVRIVQSTITHAGKTFEYTFPPQSVTSVVLTIGPDSVD